MPKQDTRLGNDEAFEVYDNAWYHAMSRLKQIVRLGDDVNAIKASEVVLEYSKHFTILGAPYVPHNEPPTDLEGNYD